MLLVAPSRSYRVYSYIQATEKLGFKLLIVSDSKHSLVSAIASGITVDFNNSSEALETVLKEIAGAHIVAVIATDDRVVTLSSRIAASLGLPHNKIQSTELTRRKDLARIRLKQAGCNVPQFQVVEFSRAVAEAKTVAYPVVAKPLMLSGSRGVIRANNAHEFIAAAAAIKEIVQAEQYSNYEASHFLIEEFLAGDEIALDGFVQNGKFMLLALFDKPEPLNGPYFEESYYITPSKRSEASKQAIIDEIEKCCHAYGLAHGPVHAEARITANGIVLLEMASRTIGGQCAQLIEYAVNSKLEEIIIQLMCFRPMNLNPSPNHAGVLMIPIKNRGVLKRVEGLLEAQKVKHITNIEIHIQPGYELVPLPFGSSYLGFIFASAKRYEDVFCALKKAHEQLAFITTPSWALQPAASEVGDL